MFPPQVSVIVVSYNTSGKLRRCLTQIGKEFEVIVVDNASVDGSPQMVKNDFPHVRLVENNFNAGFGAANNIGAKLAEANLLLFLNSDAYAEPNAINGLAKQFSDPTVIGAGGKLLNLDGTVQASTANRLTLWAVFCEQFYLEKLAPSSSILSPYWTTRRIVGLPSPVEVEQVMGACLMIRAGTELFDERYFLYCEDTDLCVRLRRRGRILYDRNSEFAHELGSSSTSPVRGVYRYNKGKELYFRIHHGRLASYLCTALDRSGATFRSLFWLCRGKAGLTKFKGFMAIAFGREP